MEPDSIYFEEMAEVLRKCRVPAAGLSGYDKKVFHKKAKPYF